MALVWQKPPSPVQSIEEREQEPHDEPAPRTYFSMVSYNNRLYVFGGFGDQANSQANSQAKLRFDDVHCYTYPKGWTNLSHMNHFLTIKGDAPPPTYLHSAVVYKNLMIVFGGNQAAAKQPNNHPSFQSANPGKDSNEIYVLDLDQRIWRRINQSVNQSIHQSMTQQSIQSFNQPTNQPCPRYGHAATIVGDQMIIVGGCSTSVKQPNNQSNNQYLNDVWSYDLLTGKWRTLSPLPIAVAYHSIWSNQPTNSSTNQSINQSTNQPVYVYGGFNGKSYSDHLYKLDLNPLNNQSANPFDQSINQSNNQWSLVKVSGHSPPALCGAAVSAIDQSINQTSVKHLYVFGGYSAAGHSNDLYRLTINSSNQTYVWECLQSIKQSINQSNSQPVSRAYLQSSIINVPINQTSTQPYLFVFGGYEGKGCVADFRMLPISQPSNQSNHQSINQSNNPFLPVAQPALPANRPPPPVSQPLHQPNSQQISQSIIPSINQSNNQSNNALDELTSLFAGVQVRPGSVHPVSQSQPINQPINQTNNQPNGINQSNHVNGINQSNYVNGISPSNNQSNNQTMSPVIDFLKSKQFLDRHDLESLIRQLQSINQSPSSSNNQSNNQPINQPKPPVRMPVVPPKPSLFAGVIPNHLITQTQPANQSMSQSINQYHRLQDVIDIGFTRAYVIQVMTDIYKESNNQSNNQPSKSFHWDFEYIVERCLHGQSNNQYNQYNQSNNQSNNQSKESKESKECVICYERTMDCVFLECAHFMSCMECARAMTAQSKECPICRKTIKSLLKIYWT